MSYLSPRVKATMMSDADFLDPAPVVSDANLLDTIVSVKQCTSITRPSSPFEGQWIYETDTQCLRRWDSNSSNWYLRAGSINSTSASVGLILTATNAAAATIPNGVSSQANVALISWNTPVKKGKSYKVVEDGWISLTGSAGLWTDTGHLNYDLRSYANTSPVSPISQYETYSTLSLTMPKGAMPTRFAYRRTWFYSIPSNAVGSVTLYGAVYLITDQTKITSGLVLGKPADATVPAVVRVYDCGLTTGN
jgi:hypothetical protein